ncbi:F0F1 ATP synthase subunit delta [Opitutus sp. GAS368]|jgi:F-type H+-transporting ATPase subunit delta|uniref:F0F1 ATP synthase subunit delta n=1 Tax=Opitutus sp. GAS368 TaxID=1882749 RepID=UPI000879BCEB|nr:F0F1 ATP synthase subunit delta [Opitutus sp. GAS368]SDR95026.1 F-type H+-transporting ATPase subunit delta [Opitutus sp. GAS368]
MRADKKTKALAKQLFKLSVVNGTVSPEQVTGVLGYIEKNVPRHGLAVLKLYHRAITTELAKSNAVVEHAGPIGDSTLQSIEAAMTRNYSRPVTATAKPNPKLLAGLRVRIGSDVYESTIAGQLAALSSAV